MMTESKSELAKQIQSEYHKKLKDLESKLAVQHKELNQIEQGIKHEAKKVYGSNLSALKAKKVELNTHINKLKKEMKQLNKERIKKLKKL
jgi:uncharacterized coiled-coil protein SlyX